MPRPIPGHVIEVDGLNVVFVIIATEFERWVRRRLSNMIGHNMIKGARQRIGRIFDFKGSNAGQKA